MKDLSRKYFFAALVLVYLLTVLGLPVYLHYCGGEVEEVSYLVKTNSCCDGEEPADDGCCRDEGLLIRNSTDFVIKNFSADLVQTVTQLFVVPRSFVFYDHQQDVLPRPEQRPSPPWQNGLLAEITVMRI